MAETGLELMRPYLHEFLTVAYEDYDIVIWSATGMKWIEEKMKLLGVTNNPNYKIAFHLDSLAMISVHSAKYGVMDVSHFYLGVLFCILEIVGEAVRSNMGEIQAVQQQEHDNVRRHPPQLHHEPKERVAHTALQAGAPEPRDRQGTDAPVQVP